MRRTADFTLYFKLSMFPLMMALAEEEEPPTSPQTEETMLDEDDQHKNPSAAVLRFFLVVGLLFLIIGSILLALLLLRFYYDNHREDKSHTTTKDDEEGSDEEAAVVEENRHVGVLDLSEEEAELELHHQSSLRDTIHRVLSARSHDAIDEHSVRSGIDIIYGEDDEEEEIVSRPTVFELNSDLQWQAWEEFESSHTSLEATPLENGGWVHRNEPLYTRSEL